MQPLYPYTYIKKKHNSTYLLHKGLKSTWDLICMNEETVYYKTSRSQGKKKQNQPIMYHKLFSHPHFHLVTATFSGYCSLCFNTGLYPLPVLKLSGMTHHLPLK